MENKVDMIVDRRLIIDIGVRERKIGLRMVIIVIGKEILKRIVRKEDFEIEI